MTIEGRAPGRVAVLAQSSFPFLALLYAALFCAFGIESPFLPSFLSERGLSAPEIGLALSAGTLVRLSAGPLLGLAADRFGTRLVLGLATIGAGTIGSLYLAAWRFDTLLAISMLHSLATASLTPLADALALAASAREGAYPYGWVRGVGSASFILGTILSGQLVAHLGLGSVVAASSLVFILAAPPVPRLRPVASASTERVAGGLRAMLQQPLFLRMLLVAGLVIGSHAMSDTFAVLHWRAAGIGAGTVGALLAEAVLSETAVFIVLGPVLLRVLGTGGCAAVAAVAGVLRWATLATTTSVAALAATELFHGLTFSLVHLACMQVIGTTVPERLSATAQTLYGTLCLGLASAFITLASGPLYAAFGAHAFFAMSALCALALPIALSLRGRT